ncbi:unnamed protein product [Closterium sp. Yama58-4]|nr:unnamed protein product [Closterium sp. Yama58-4]
MVISRRNRRRTAGAAGQGHGERSSLFQFSHVARSKRFWLICIALVAGYNLLVMNLAGREVDSPPLRVWSFLLGGSDVERVPGDPALADEPTADVTTKALYDEIAFENLPGGVWTQGFPLEYTGHEWDEEPLRVLVVPHSHNDPGWLETVEQYYRSSTRGIIDTIVNSLSEKPTRKFIWEEMSYLSRWWMDASEEMKGKLKALLQNGQLEIVGGGWVMNDEANSHYFAILEQITEGNTWLHDAVGVVPTNSWSIDPFGYSATMPYLLHQSGFHNMLIQRVHYENVAERAATILDQWRKKSLLYRSKVVLVPLGDDFRYPTMREAQAQFTNYELLFDYFNSHPHLRVNASFGTLGDYFNAVREAAVRDATLHSKGAVNEASAVNEATAVNESGWFGRGATWRCFNTTTASQGRLRHNNTGPVPLFSSSSFTSFAERLVRARRNLALFQHHDGITGTARDPVVVDYGLRMHTALNDLNDLMCAAVVALLSDSPTQDPEKSPVQLRPEQHRTQQHILPSHLPLSFPASSPHTASSTPGSAGVGGGGEGEERGAGAGGTGEGGTGEGGTGEGGTGEGVGARRRVLEVKAGEQPGTEQRGLEVQEEGGAGGTVRRVVVYNPLEEEVKQVISVVVEIPLVAVLSPKGTCLPAQVMPEWVNPPTFTPKPPQNASSTTTTSAVAGGDGMSEGAASGAGTLRFHGGLPGGGLPGGGVGGGGVGEGGVGGGVGEGGEVGHRIRNRVHDDGDFDAAARSDLPDQVITVRSTDTAAAGGDGAEVGVEEDEGEQGSKEGDLDLDELQKVAEAAAKMDKQGWEEAADGLEESHVVDEPLLQEEEEEEHLMPVVRSVMLYKVRAPQGLLIETRHHVNISSTSVDNKELVVRYRTSIDSSRLFYTDSNGFQTVRRETLPKLPTQGNFYPMPALAFLQDPSGIRFSVHTRQAVGVASLKTGWLEMMLDRRLPQDDNRGMQQGVLDNHPTHTIFHLVLEKNTSARPFPAAASSAALLPSLTSQRIGSRLNYPVYLFVGQPESPSIFVSGQDGDAGRGAGRKGSGSSSSNGGKAVKPGVLAGTVEPKPGGLGWTYAPLGRPLPCNMHVVSFKVHRPMPNASVHSEPPLALLLHRRGFDHSFGGAHREAPCKITPTGQVHLARLFSGAYVTEFEEFPLNLVRPSPIAADSGGPGQGYEDSLGLANMPYTGKSSLALIARVSAVGVGLAYGAAMLTYLRAQKAAAAKKNPGHH